MCDRCDEALDALLTIQLADGFTYRRQMTDVEFRFGDVARVRQDYDAAERAGVTEGAPVVKRMVEQLARESWQAHQSGDLSALTKLSPSFVGELTAALRAAVKVAKGYGYQQVRDQYVAQTGTKLATPKLPPAIRRVPAKAEEYMDAKADVLAQSVADNVSKAIANTALTSAAQGLGEKAWTDKADEVGRGVGERSLVGAATAIGREGVATGRLVAYDEVKSEVEQVVYTAILDDSVCDACAAKDGNTYGADEYGQTPNDDCDGAPWGRCRCFEVIVFQRDNSVAPDGTSGPRDGEVPTEPPAPAPDATAPAPDDRSEADKIAALTTAQEAEDYANARWEHTAFDFAGIHDEVAPQVVAAFDKLDAQFPGFIGGTFTDDRGKTVPWFPQVQGKPQGWGGFDGAIAHQLFGGGMGLNPTYFGQDAAALDAILARMETTGFSRCSDVERVITHEFGHALDGRFGSPYGRSLGIPGPITAFKMGRDRAADVYALSRYAAKNKLERWAEAFTSAMHDAEPGKVASKIDLAKLREFVAEQIATRQ